MPTVSSMISLKKFNTFGVHATAEHFIEVTNNQEFKEAMEWANARSIVPLILGGGSNVLLTQHEYPLVIHNSIKGIEKESESEEFVWVRAGSGEVWHQFVMYCIDQGWGGVENLSLIPGTVGAAPMQNIGAYGVEIKEVFESLEAIDVSSGEIVNFNCSACAFGYRESVFKKKFKGKYFIASVLIRLTKRHQLNTSYGAIAQVLESKNIEHPTIKDVSDAVISIRKSKLPDPAEIGNAGSFFKNPVIAERKYMDLQKNYPAMPGYPQADDKVKVPAGWLIEQCGWKGIREGDIGVHKNQALVLVNYNDGKGESIRQLAMRIKDAVYDQFQIDITPEVNII